MTITDEQVRAACPFCGDTRTPIIDHDDVVERKITGYDEDNGPIYFAICQYCAARGPAVGWAADVLTAWGKRAALASVQREGVKMPGTVGYMETHGGHAQEPLIIRSEMIAAMKAANIEVIP